MESQLECLDMEEPIGRPRYLQGNWEVRHPRDEAKKLISEMGIPIPKSLLFVKLTFKLEAKWKQFKIQNKFFAFSRDQSNTINASSANWRCEICTFHDQLQGP